MELAHDSKSEDYTSSDWDLVFPMNLPSDESAATQTDQMDKFDEIMHGSLTEADTYNLQSQEDQLLQPDMYVELANTDFVMHTGYEDMEQVLSEPVPVAHRTNGAPPVTTASAPVVPKPGTPIPAIPTTAVPVNRGRIASLPAVKHVQASVQSDDELDSTMESPTPTGAPKQRSSTITESHNQVLNRANISSPFVESQHTGLTAHGHARENLNVPSSADTRVNRIRAQSTQQSAYNTPRIRHSQLQETTESLNHSRDSDQLLHSVNSYNPSQGTIARGYGSTRNLPYGILSPVNQPYFLGSTHQPHGPIPNPLLSYARQPVPGPTTFEDGMGRWVPHINGRETGQYTLNRTGRSVSHNDLLQAQMEREPSSTYDEDIYPTHQLMGRQAMNQLYFPSMDAADAARATQGTAWPHHDHTWPTTTDMERMYVGQLYDAMLDMDAPLDNPGMVAMWSRLMTREREVELTCWDILKACIKSHRQSEPLVMGGKQGKNYKCFQDHIFDICESMRLQKTICKHLFAPPYIYQLVDDPIGSAHRIANNRKVNDGKKVAITAGRIAMLKKKKAAQRLQQGNDNGADDDLDEFDDDDNAYSDPPDDDGDYPNFRSSGQASTTRHKTAPKSKKASKKRKSMDRGDAPFRAAGTRSRPRKRSNTSVYEIVQDPVTGSYRIGTRQEAENRRRASATNVLSHPMGPLDPTLGSSAYRQAQTGQYPTISPPTDTQEEGENPEITPEPTLPNSRRRQNKRR